MDNFSWKNCRSSTWKFFDSAQRFFDTVIKTVIYMFDTTFLSYFFPEKAVFELKFPVDCETCIVDVQTDKTFKKFLERSGTSFGLWRNGFVRDAKTPFYGYLGVI